MSYSRKLRTARAFALSTFSPKRSKAIKRRAAIKNVKKNLSGAAVNAAAVVAILLCVVFVVQALFSGGKPNGAIDDITAFRMPAAAALAILELSKKYELDPAEMITLFSLDHNFFPDKSFVNTDAKSIEKNYILNYTNIRDSYSGDAFLSYYSFLKDIMDDIVYFPVPYGYDEYMYGDGFKSRRDDSNYGCEILDRENIRGRLPIVSMTAGSVESVGFDDEKGYYVRIRSSTGGEYFYSGFDTVKEQITEGAPIRAGDAIGFAGETKNGASVGVFIAISPESKLFKEQVWVNPYVFLRIAEYENNLNESAAEDISNE